MGLMQALSSPPARRGSLAGVCYPARMQNDSHPPQPPPEQPPRSRRAGPLAVARAVAGSFLGIRKARDLDADASSITPAQAIIGGLIGAAVLIASLLGLVMFITRG